MDLGLKGKRVLVSGGTKSIGRAIVDAFVAEGAVVGFDIDHDYLKQVTVREEVVKLQ